MWATLQCIRRKVSGGESLEKNISAFRWKWANNSSSVLSKQRIHRYCSDVYSKPTAFTLCILLPMHTLSSATVPLFCMYMNFCNVHLRRHKHEQGVDFWNNSDPWKELCLWPFTSG